MEKKAVIYTPDSDCCTPLTFKIGDDHVKDIILAIDNVLGVYFDDGSKSMFCNLPFEYHEIEEEANNE